MREESESMEKQLYKVLKTGMTVFLLVMAYFLPGICLEMTARPEAAGGERQVMAEAGGETETQAAPRKTIVLDPGHGGEDPGMVGIGGVEEKGINLQVALALKTLLEEQGYSVVLTRNDDNGLYDAGSANKKAQDMQRRCALIEAEDPVLTVSIHQNSYTDPAVYGPQVFYFEHSEEGRILASCIQEALNTGLEIKKPRAVKANTNYYILKRSASVTVLVECAFLSNPDEAEKIGTEEYREALARAICEGILEYCTLRSQ